MNLVAGCIVEFSGKGSRPGFATVLGNASGNVRLLLPNGKEMTVTEKKILHATSRAVVSTADREACRAAMNDIDKKRQELELAINLEEVHELLADENRSFSLKDIAGYLFASDDEDSAAALLRVLADDKLFFKQKNDLYTPMTADEIKLIRNQLDKKQALEQEESDLIADLNDAQSGNSISERLLNRLNELKLFVAWGEEANINKRLLAALEKTGLTNQRKMFTLLVNCGVFHVDENLLLTKYQVPVDFSPQLLEDAEELIRLAEAKNFCDRLDLRKLKTWAIDTPGSKDRDDAFSFEIGVDGKSQLFVHIADPAEFIKPGSPLDIEAARRGSSIYMPDGRIHMLPPRISEDHLSLSAGSDRPALSFIMTFDGEASLVSLEIKETIINIDTATEYDLADQLLNTDGWLTQAHAFAERLKSRRAAAGAAMFPRQPELEVKVKDGDIIVSHRNRDDLTAGMIAEFMIWANHAAADWCRLQQVPCLYRVQEAGEVEAQFGEEFDPISFYAALRSFRKTTTSANPGRHASLGLSSYTQVTSPLRRYADMLLHRQIKAAIRGEALPYGQNELNQAMLYADEAIGRADEIMRDRERYFLLKHLKQRQKSEQLLLDAIVVDQSMNDVTFYSEYLCSFRHCRKPSFDLATGQKVKARINQIDLFDGIIRFDLINP